MPLGTAGGTGDAAGGAGRDDGGPKRDRPRKIVLLRCQENLSFREIARQCGIKEAAARKRFERARKAMIKQKGVTSYEQLFSL